MELTRRRVAEAVHGVLLSRLASLFRHCPARPITNTMEHDTFTAEHRSWQWELMHAFEEGSLTAAQWTAETLRIVAGWYAKTLSPADARKRYTLHYQRNRHRLTHRLGGAPVNLAVIEELDAQWESVLEQALAAKAP